MSILLTASTPQRTLAELALSGVPLTAPSALRPCEMYLDHGSAEPSITQGHHLRPVYLQNRLWGGIKDGALAFLCGTCHDNVHAWIYWLTGERKKPDPEPPPRAQKMARETVEWYLAEKALSESG